MNWNVRMTPVSVLAERFFTTSQLWISVAALIPYFSIDANQKGRAWWQVDKWGNRVWELTVVKEIPAKWPYWHAALLWCEWKRAHVCVCLRAKANLAETSVQTGLVGLAGFVQPPLIFLVSVYLTLSLSTHHISLPSSRLFPVYLSSVYWRGYELVMS